MLPEISGCAARAERFARGPAPVSLGMVGDGRNPVTAVGVPADTTEVALSVEPAGGSAAPTLVVATGKLT